MLLLRASRRAVFVLENNDVNDCGFLRTAGDVLVNRQGVGVIRSSGGDAYRARLADQDSAGDATVPANSGLAPRPHAAFFAEMRGFEHQGSYDDAQVQAVTLYSVIRIALNAPGLPP